MGNGILKELNDSLVFNPVARWLFENLANERQQETIQNLQGAFVALACFAVKARNEQQPEIYLDETQLEQLAGLIDSLQQACLSWEQFKNIGIDTTDRVFIIAG
jgi:hypothetical protein